MEELAKTYPTLTQFQFLVTLIRNHFIYVTFIKHLKVLSLHICKSLDILCSGQHLKTKMNEQKLFSYGSSQGIFPYRTVIICGLTV